MPMMTSCDLAIIGGGVIGSAVAYFLAAESAFGGRIVVIERDPSYARAATTLSAGSIRLQFSTPENIEMSKFGARFLAEAETLLAVGDERPQLGFHPGGYLFLASPAGAKNLRRNHALQRRHGAEVALLDPDALAARFPWLDTTGIALGALGLSQEGWFDPHALLQGFRRKARELGVVYVSGEAAGIELDASRVAAVRLAGGERIACSAAVNAAGPQAGKVAALAGLELPVRPRKRFVYVFDCRTAIPGAPLLIDPSGVYMRPEGRFFISGVTPPPDADPDCEDLEVEYELWENVVWPTLAERVPAFAAVKLQSAWAGHYDYNTVDQNGIIGPHPEVPNLFFANGFSGHGLQHAPAAGRAIAELVVFGGYRSLDLTRLGYERFRLNRPVIERNVV